MTGLRLLRRHAACRRPPANAQDTVKIGVIMSYSGQFADAGAQIDNGIKLYMKQHGDTVAGKKIEIIRKDTGGIAPDVAKRLAQELIVRDKVDILAGYRPHAERARRRRRIGAGQEVHGQHERGDLGHHHQVALHGAHLVHGVAAQRGARHLGLQERRAQGLHAGVRLRPRPRRRSRLPQGLQGRRRRDHRLGALSGREPGLRRVPAARQGRQPRRHLHLGARAARSRRRSARRSPSAGSTRARSRSWARAS